MLWVLIRSALVSTYTEYHDLCFCGEIRKISIHFNHFITRLFITRFEDGSKKCIDYKWSFFNIIYTFLFGYNGFLTNTVYAMDPNNSIIKMLWYTFRLKKHLILCCVLEYRSSHR